MADRVLVISWGQPVRGREQHGLEVLAEATGLYGEMQQAGRIEGFDLILTDPNRFMNGCFILRGSHAQLDDVREDMRFRRSMVDAELVVDDLAIVDGFTGAGIEHVLPLYTDAVERVPQMA
jgi:hypothetical protein